MATKKTDTNVVKMEADMLRDMLQYIADNPATDTPPTLWERLLARFRFSRNLIAATNAKPSTWDYGEYNSIEAVATAAVFKAYGLGQDGGGVDRLRAIASNVGMPIKILLQELEQQPHADKAEKLGEMLAELRKLSKEVFETAEEKTQTAAKLDYLKKQLVTYMADLDYSKTCNVPPNFTEAEKETLRNTILYTEGGMGVYNSLNAEWQSLRRYAGFVDKYAVNPYLIEVAKLFGKISQYEKLTELVESLNAYHILQQTRETITKLGKALGAEASDRTTQYFNNIAQNLPQQIILDLKADNPTPYKIRARDEKALWADIKRQAKVVAKAMAEVKGCIEAANAYWLTGRLGIIPYYFEKEAENMANNTKERYYFNDNDKYYKGFLNDKIKDGYQPTQEQEKWALIPDYNEIKRDEKAYQLGKEQIAEAAEPAV